MLLGRDCCRRRTGLRPCRTRWPRGQQHCRRRPTLAHRGRAGRRTRSGARS
ncbi:hypothetical protein TSOC_013937 [Tetrabaena socialis]|uniref:Uncharacterized protein n=1 Tax=Tetrabaena socialis TaxID=47790 RepID=A0A2J7ZJ23_9CHLO|nr:hypothetical protein TSOC_013937 [Tetrabaena socialis]|eukprot:PNH00250.1 hypothetical protein TSOC_013937 [Tetrabaena socialis]